MVCKTGPRTLDSGRASSAPSSTVKGTVGDSDGVVGLGDSTAQSEAGLGCAAGILQEVSESNKVLAGEFISFLSGDGGPSSEQPEELAFPAPAKRYEEMH